MVDDHHGSFWKDPKRILGTTDAREIGYLYFVLAFVNATISGFYALLIRWELWTPELDYFEANIDYNAAFTLHGTAMIFLVIIPLGAGMGNYLIPRMVSSINADMYWPKWNNVAFWMMIPASLLIWVSAATAGWTGYAPLSVQALGSTPGIDAWIFGLVLAGMSSTIGSINFILTIWRGRDPTIKWMELDLFVWGTLLTSLLLLLTTPSVVLAIVMVFFDRNLHTSFFFDTINSVPTAPVMYQHLFWFFAHPEVYVMVMPAFGLISLVIARFARTEIFGYTGMVAAFISIAVLSFVVWAHHMYTTGMNPLVRVAFTTMTFAIAIPSGIKVFNWITTLYAGRIKLDVPMLFSLSFIIMFTLGGITGVYVNIVPIDIYLHDTYWVVGHFHFVVAAGTLQAFFAAIYYYFPDMTGKVYDKLTAQVHFWFWSIGNLVTFTAFTLLGYEGMPRRYATYLPQFQGLHQAATIGAFFMGLSFIFFFVSIFLGYFKGEDADLDNIHSLGHGYKFPKPFAERMKEEEGIDIEVEHSLSLWSAAAGFMLSVPLIAILAMLNTGIFAPPDVAEGITNGFILGLTDAASTGLGWGLMAIFFLFVGAFFYYESIAEKSTQLIDQYKGDRNWEIWVFLASEIIFFGILIGIGLAMRFNAEQWPDPRGSGVEYMSTEEVLAIELTAVNTFILIISSFTMAKAVEAISKGDQQKLQQFLLATIGLGITFLSIQIFEYTEMFHEGHVALIEEGADFPNFSSAFFIQTGFHGAHVLIGIALLIFVFLRARQGGYSAENHEYVEFVGLYWHLVDLVWIILFTVVYLI